MILVSFHTTLFNITTYIILELVVSTRFGAKPPLADTFMNFQPPSNSASYLPERTRVSAMTGNRFLDSNVEFQREERVKKLNLQQARTDIKRANINNLNQKIFEGELKKETQYGTKLSQKAALSDLYERLCHMQAL